MVDVDLDQTKHLSHISAHDMCMTSAWLSWFSCLTAQWATFNIAVYLFQAMREFCSRCCCSLVRKRNLVITIICQVLINLAVITVYVIEIDKKYISFGTDSLFGLSLQDYDKDTIHYQDIDIINDVVHIEIYNTTEFSVHSRRERIVEIFGRCALTQSNGYGSFCSVSKSFTHDNQTTIYNSSVCIMNSLAVNSTIMNFIIRIEATVIALITASLNTVLTLTCAFLYLLVCLKLRGRSANITGRSDMHKLQLRLSVIVLLDTLCWIPVTVLHWIDFNVLNLTNVNWPNDSTATSVLLISISPAINPLIYTFTEKNFLHSIRRRMKCNISLRRNNFNCHDDHVRGVERCSCIPCVRCVHRDEENDPDYWHTQDTSDWNSEQSRLLPSTSESSETS